MMHYAFVELRMLGWEGRAEQAAALADTFHNLPHEIYRNEGFNVKLFRGMLEDYQAKYHGEAYRGKFNYVTMLDKFMPVA